MGVICINCGWENHPESSICEKCKQPLNYDNSSKDITLDSTLSPHTTVEAYRFEAVGNKILNSRYELTALIHNDDYSEIWAANDLLTNEIISIKMALDADHNDKIFQEYSFLSNFRYAGIYNPFHYDLH